MHEDFLSSDNLAETAQVAEVYRGVCVCVCVCARACVCVCVCKTPHKYIDTYIVGSAGGEMRGRAERPSRNIMQKCKNELRKSG